MSAIDETQAATVVVAGRYEILGLLGAGAMGTVYRARDRELDEIVALKLLRKELASPEMLERFRREVKLARRVTHANVARTFDIGESDGDRFLTMELVEGEMLAAKLARKRVLGPQEAITIALDVCAGLAAAHAAGVLHRDLKPENVIVAKDGRAVITDFGIARAAASTTRTAAGIVGTPAYMAPEQVEGGELDARADLYALGTMLYELVTGELAWSGDEIMAVAAARLLRPPPDPRALVPGLPAPLAETILRLMARRRDDRFASADDTATALRTTLAGLTTTERPPPLVTSPGMPAAVPAGGTLKIRDVRGARVLAVLPPASATPDDAYLVDGLHEDIVDLLSVVPGLAVRPRGDTLRFRSADRDLRAIGRELVADVVVDASFRRLGDAVRVSFRLVAVEDGIQLWARRFDRPAAEVLVIADEAAQAIAAALTTELRMRGRTPASPEAEDLYLRGRYMLRRGWNEVARDAVDLLARAHQAAPDDLRIAGTYALSLARAYGLTSFGPEVVEHARKLAIEVITADPQQVDAHCALGLLAFNLHEGPEAIRHYRKALACAPHSLEALDWSGRILGEVGLVDDALALLQRAASIDLEAPMPSIQRARILMMLGDRAGVRAALGPMPKHPGDTAAWTMVRAREALWHRDVADARALLGELAQAELPPPVRFALESYLRVVVGDGDALLADRALVERMLPVDASVAGPRRGAFHAQLQAEVYASVSRFAEAQAAVAAADANGLLDIVWFDRCPLLDMMRSNLEGIRARIAARAERVVAAVRN